MALLLCRWAIHPSPASRPWCSGHQPGSPRHGPRVLPHSPQPCSPTKPVCGRGVPGHCSPGPPCPAWAEPSPGSNPPGDHLPSWGWEQQQLLKVGFVRTRISRFSGVTQSRTFAWCGTPSQDGGRVHTLLLAPVPPSLLQRFSWANPASSTSEGSPGPWLTNQCTPPWLHHHDWFRMSK